MSRTGPRVRKTRHEKAVGSRTWLGLVGPHRTRTSDSSLNQVHPALRLTNHDDS